MSGRSLLALLLVGAALAGCVQPPADLGPAADAGAALEAGLLAVVPATITGMSLASSVEFGAANDLAFHGPHVYVATHNNGMRIVDASDPANAVEIAAVDCNGKDIGLVQLGERLIVTISSQGDDACPDAAATGGVRLVDVTNATAPVVLGQVPLKYGSHTHTPYGHTGILYNSAYNLAKNPAASPKDHSRSEIIDITNPEDPKVVGELRFPETSTSIGCHDILAEPELDRAVCAAISETMIWDTTDPLAPKITDTLVNPLINIHHSAATARNGTLLVLGDEFAGVLAPACNPSGMGPTGAIWFYEIDGYSFGKELGYLPPPAGELGQVCTAHNFNVIDGHDLLVAGFYTAGSLLVDFSDPTAPAVVQQHVQPGTSSWATYFHAGAVFSGDGGRGLDVYLLEGGDAAGHDHEAQGVLDALRGLVG